MDELMNGDYAALLGEIKTRIPSAQYALNKPVSAFVPPGVSV